MRKLNLFPETDLITETLKVADLVLEQGGELEEDFVNSLFDFLDEEVSSETVLKYAKLIFEEGDGRIQFTNNYEEYRLFWNLGFISGKANLWGLSRYFFEKVSKN